MRNVEISVYKFNELPDKTKLKVIDKFSDIYLNYQWWDFIYWDAERIGLKITEFDTYYKTISIEYTEDADYVASSILKEYGECTDMYKLASKFIKEYESLVNAEEPSASDIEDMEEEFLDAIGEDFLSSLISEYEWRSSEEAIAEYITDNNYEFTENGTIY